MHYVIDQSMISIFDLKKMFGGETKYNTWDSTYTVMLNNYLISINGKLNMVLIIEIISDPCIY